jgi:hypothetical protein
MLPRRSALVLSKLGAKALSTPCKSLHGFHGNLELKIARSADSDCRDRVKPFERTNVSLLRAVISPPGPLHAYPSERRESRFSFQHLSQWLLSRTLHVG